MTLPPIYLASTSPRRIALLHMLGIPFIQLAPDGLGAIEANNADAPIACALHNSLNKARSALKHYQHGLVIGADTIVVLERTILGKPDSPEQAVSFLSSLSGRTHDVISGVTVGCLETAEFRSEHALTKVHFRDLTRAEIQAYVATEECFDKAGAYAIQEKAAIFIDRIQGCFSNVIGLPLVVLNRLLNHFGLACSNFW
ncbi:septum formation protein Maf [bacterium]|nr:septum formation protein Maf [bacterium]